MSDLCPECHTKLEDAPGIGRFCPNRVCPVVDGPDLWDGKGNRSPSVFETESSTDTLKFNQQIKSIVKLSFQKGYDVGRYDQQEFPDNENWNDEEIINYKFQIFWKSLDV